MSKKTRPDVWVGPRLVERLRELEERLRVRDARVEPPPLRTWILYWDGTVWALDCYDARDRRWEDTCESIDDKPYWLPMPPGPEAP